MLRSALSPTSAYVSAGNRASSRERPVNAKRRRTRTKRKVCLQASSSLAPSRSLSSRAGIPWGRELTKQTIEHSAVECPYLPITWETSSAHSNRRSGCGHLALACDDNEPASASNRCARSSRIRPANDRETSRSDGNGWSIESAVRNQIRPSPQVARSAPRNTLKVETRVRTPLGLRTENPVGRRQLNRWPGGRPGAQRYVPVLAC